MLAEYFLTNFNELLAKSDLNQNRFAKAIGMPQPTISNWYKRKTVPSHEVIEKLAEFFKVKPHYFFMEPGTQGEIKPLDDANDFGILLDDLAEKHLEPLILSEWRRMGSKREFVRILRYNFETKEAVGPNWYLALRKELLKYVAVEPAQKMRDLFEKMQAEKAQSLKSKA